MSKPKNVITFGALVLTVSLSFTTAYAADKGTVSGVISTDNAIVINEMTKHCPSCTKNKLKAGMWQIGVYR